MAQVEFKSGWEEIPDYLAEMMAGIETHLLTRDEATRRVEWELAADHANRAQRDIVRRHFKERKWEP